MERTGLFSNPGLSSPVILVFMAIGVCFAAGISFFAWRRFLLAQNPTILHSRSTRGIRYWMETNDGSARADVGHKPVVFDLWTRLGDNSTYFGWGQITPLSVTLTTSKGTEKAHLASPNRQFSLPPSSQTQSQPSSNVPDDQVVQPTRAIWGTAQVALSIVFPDEQRKEDSFGHYAIGVTAVDLIAGVKKELCIGT